MSIPASVFVNITPSVLGAGGNPLALNGMILSIAAALPVGAPVAFPDAASVGTYFGPTSQEYAMSQTYFQGYTNSFTKPATLYFSRYAKAAIGAFNRGGANSLTLAQIQAIIPAVTTSSASIAATVMTVGALASGAIVQGQLVTGAGVTVGTRVGAQLTGTAGGAGTYTVSPSQTVAGPIVATCAYDLTVSVDGTPATAANVNLSAATSFSSAASLVAAALGAGAVTYASNFTAYVIASTTTGATSTLGYGSGALATTLGFTQLAGAVLSQGSAIMVPSAAMDTIVLNTQNWACFTTAFEPDASSSAYTVKKAFAVWNSTANSVQTGRFMYAPWDANPLVVAANGATVNTLGQSIIADSVGGTASLYAPTALDPNGLVSAFLLGAVASIDFTSADGRIALKYKRGTNVPVTVVDTTTYTNLLANGYSAYVVAATASQDFRFLADGSISGVFLWIDNYIDQLYMNSQFQVAWMSFFMNSNSNPYNAAGYTKLGAAIQPVIDQMVRFGGIRSGVNLSPAQVQQMNAAAGLDISRVMLSRGWYLQILDADSATRIARKSPPIKFWYTDGQSVQTINMASINVL